VNLFYAGNIDEVIKPEFAVMHWTSYILKNNFVKLKLRCIHAQARQNHEEAARAIKEQLNTLVQRLRDGGHGNIQFKKEVHFYTYRVHNFLLNPC